MKFMQLILRRPVSVVMLLVAVIVFGIGSLTGMSLNYLPDFEMPMELVIITWPAADADSIDRLVTQQVEDKCETLTDINSVTSYTYDNYTMIQLIYNYGTDSDDMYSDLKSAMDSMKSDLPEDCEDPVIMEIKTDAMPNMVISAVAPEGVDVVQYLNDTVVPSLESMNEVAQVEVTGTQDDYVRIVIDETKLDQYGLSVSSIGSAIAAADFEMPVGSVTMGSQDIALNAEGDVHVGDDDSTATLISTLKEFPIQTSSGQIVKLNDIALFLNIDQKEAESVSRYNGNDSVMMSLTKQDSAATVNVCNDVMEQLKEYESDGLTFEIIYNESDSIMDTLMSILQTLITGVILAMIVLWLFFGNLRASLVVGISMPLSILLAVIFLNFAGFDINMMSGTALVIAIGMIVDNSIVILESCFRMREDGLDFKQAAVTGASSMIMSILAGTLTTVVVYFPLAISSGMAGMMSGPLCWTIILTMSASFLCAVVVVPLAFYKLRPVNKEDIPINRLLHRFQNFYRRVMPRLLIHPGRVVMVGVGCFAVAILIASQMEFVLMPDNYDGSINLDITFRSGTKLEVMDERIRNIESELIADENFEKVTLEISDNTASFTAYAVDGCNRSSEKAVTEYINDFGHIAGMDVEISPTSSATDISSMSGGSNSTDVMLVSEDMDSLKEGIEMVDEVMLNTNGVISIDNPFDESRMKGRLIINTQKALMAGTTESSVAMQINYMLNGMTATQIDYEDDEYDVIIEYPEGMYDDVVSLMDHAIATQSGKMITLQDIADVEYVTALPVINRQDGYYCATIVATTTDEAKYEADDAISDAVAELEFPDGVDIGLSAQSSMQNDEIGNLVAAMLSALFLVFLVMAVQFNSVRLSVMVIMCIPLSLIGSFGLTFISGKPLSMFGMMGFMMLFGISVNNGIYLVDGTNQLRQEMPLNEALVQAGVTRLRPILMTTLTTVLSMLPMIFSDDSGVDMMKEMTYIVIGGLVASTVLAMFLMPAFYLLIRRENLDGTRKKGILRRRKDITAEAEE